MKFTTLSLLSTVFGIMAGLGVFTFRYAEGFSYFTSDPNACANCHIMREYLDSWQKSSHHTRAVCNDCHMPDAILPKLWTKTENGWRHSVKFTLQNYPEQLQITRANARRLQNNCIKCHKELLGEVRFFHLNSPAQDLNCVRCHADVGHGPRR